MTAGDFFSIFSNAQVAVYGPAFSQPSVSVVSNQKSPV